MPQARPHASEEGPTLLFQRDLPTHERCDTCPFRQVIPEIRPPSPRPGAAILPLPPLTGPGAAPLPGTPRATAAGPHPAALPRPALLALADTRGDGTLVLPDALKPAGPEAATVARPVHPATAGTSGGAAPPVVDPRHQGFDELASPDITIMQVPAVPARVAPRRRSAPSGPDARAYFILNLCLGLLIITGLAILATREISRTPGAGRDDHVIR